MEWKKTPESLVRFFEEKTAPVLCERRKMFGFPCCFINGNMFIGTYGENLILRLGEKDRVRAAKENEDIAPFEPIPGRKMREYIVVPERIRKDARTFDRMLKSSVEYANSLPPKKSRKARERTDTA
jgi:TfoX/Sxy family transcriptional regulator of competence genes